MPDGGAKGHILKLENMLDEYYEQRGWDKKTGIPTKTELMKIGLADVATEFERLNLLQ